MYFFSINRKIGKYKMNLNRIVIFYNEVYIIILSWNGEGSDYLVGIAPKNFGWKIIGI